jgi:hypothetical protein
MDPGRIRPLGFLGMKMLKYTGHGKCAVAMLNGSQMFRLVAHHAGSHPPRFNTGVIQEVVSLLGTYVCRGHLFSVEITGLPV